MPRASQGKFSFATNSRKGELTYSFIYSRSGYPRTGMFFLAESFSTMLQNTIRQRCPGDSILGCEVASVPRPMQVVSSCTSS